MGWSEARLRELIANAVENGHAQDIPHWQRLLDDLQHQKRTNR